MVRPFALLRLTLRQWLITDPYWLNTGGWLRIVWPHTLLPVHLPFWSICPNCSYQSWSRHQKDGCPVLSFFLLYLSSLWLLMLSEASLAMRPIQPRPLTRLSNGRPYLYFSLCCVCYQPLHPWQGCLIGRWMSGDFPPLLYGVWLELEIGTSL